jgi:hypothetical protein
MALLCPICRKFPLYEVIDFLPKGLFLVAKTEIHALPLAKPNDV